MVDFSGPRTFTVSLLLLVSSMALPVVSSATDSAEFDHGRSTLLIDWDRIVSGNSCNEWNAGIETDLLLQDGLHDWLGWLDDHIRANETWLDFFSGDWESMDSVEVDRIAEEMISKGKGPSNGLVFATAPDGLGIQNALPMLWPEVFRKSGKQNMVAVKITNAFVARDGFDYDRASPGHNYTLLAGSGGYTTLEIVFDLYGGGERVGIAFVERDASQGLSHALAWLQSFTGEDPPELVEVRMFPRGQPTVGGHQPLDRLAERDWQRAQLMVDVEEPGAWGTGSVHWSNWGLLDLNAEPEPREGCVLGPATMGSSPPVGGGGSVGPTEPESAAPLAATNFDTDMRPQATLRTLPDGSVVIKTQGSGESILLADGAGWNESERELVSAWVESFESDHPELGEVEEEAPVELGATLDESATVQVSEDSPTIDVMDETSTYERDLASDSFVNAPRPEPPTPPSMLPLGLLAWSLVIASMLVLGKRRRWVPTSRPPNSAFIRN